ncbi:MAG: flagellar protein FlaG [Clostridia bacterium]|nr:flagellar protein FlaG [Clostridia bacterium]
MKINGVDPRVIDQIREQYIQPVVRDSRQIKRVDRYEEQEEREKGQFGRFSREDVKQSLDRLNSVYESFRNPIRFRLTEEDGEARVEVVDSEENRVLRAVDPEKVLAVMTQMEKLLGLLVDVFI